jgi:hypothetical protein
MAKSTIGLTGANTVIIETRKRDLVFIRVDDMPSEVKCHTRCEQLVVNVFAFPN